MVAYAVGQDSTVPDHGSKGDTDPCDPVKTELELLGDEMVRRGMKTTLAAEVDGPVLEVLNPRVTSSGGTPVRARVWHRGGQFWWIRIDAENSAADLMRAAEGVAAALRWSPIGPAAVREAVPDDT